MSDWSKLFEKLKIVYFRLQQGDFFRFNRGLFNFQKGLQENYIDFRLPYFVRSLEALILPDKGETTKQFKDRTKKWYPKNKYPDENIMTTLSEIYAMRCDFEHLHGIKEIYSKDHKLLTCRCEEIVRNAYKTILFDNNELENFTNDININKYWNKTQTNS